MLNPNMLDEDNGPSNDEIDEMAVDAAIEAAEQSPPDEE